MNVTNPPDLGELTEGNEVTVFYRSKRSGNEVERTGTVMPPIEQDDGSLVVRVHTERRGRFKEQYVGLANAEMDEEDVVLAFSVTAEAETDLDEPPVLGRTYTIRYSISRTSLLGLVDRIRKEDVHAIYASSVLGRND